jgi:hypothetical protein
MNFEFLHGKLLRLQSQTNLLFRDSERASKYWKARNTNMKSLNYNYVEIECKKIGAKSGQTDAAIFDKKNIAFKKHFSGSSRFFIGNTGYEFDAPIQFAVRHFSG